MTIGVNLSSKACPTYALPHPNPPLYKGRELESLVSPQCIGGIKGGNSTCVYTVLALDKTGVG